MAALVQSYPQQTGSVTMLQTRPTSASGILPPPQSQQNPQYAHGGSHQRNSFHGLPGGTGGVYRGNTGPVQPYAFTSTPSLNPSAQWQQFGAYRTSSTPAVPTIQAFEQAHNFGRGRYPATGSMTNLPASSSYGMSTGGSRDDSALPTTNRRVAPGPRPQSSYMAGPHSQGPFTQGGTSKAPPERYRRPGPRAGDPSGQGQQPQPQPQFSAPPSGSGMATVGHLYNSRAAPDHQGNATRSPAGMAPRPNSFYGPIPGSAVDDIQLYRHPDAEAKRFRRRSMPALDPADFPKALTPHEFRLAEEPSRLEQLAPPKGSDKEQKSTKAASSNTAVEKTVQTKNGSSESLVSSRSSNSRPSSSANRNTNVSVPTGNPALLSSVADQSSSNQDYPRLVNIPPRSSSSDAATKKVVNPSPLSKPMTMDSEADKVNAPAAAENGQDASPSRPDSSQATKMESAAAKQLAAISEKGGRRKSKTSRLRRAFSFGSAAEFRKAGGGENDSAGTPQPSVAAKLHKEPTADELYDAEQARIAQKQEAGGIGNNIYSGAKIFSGSSDNLSISSTASSASIMIRKMGRGMKKGTRSLVGLFRPKSIVGAPAAEAKPPEATQAEVSMVTVEAERERVNVNADPHDHNGGGTGFPRLERNSIDASKAPSTASERVGSSGTENSVPRKSIVGGDKERAEVLAAVRKGILKNTSGSPSPSPRPTDARGPAFDLPNVPQMADSPSSSAPSTPNDEIQGHKRTGSVAIGSEDYFVAALRLRQDTKSAPGTPQGSVKRSATFSPRLIFYDTWPSQEYDRRGDIATCNRLTPMLAQQIKEELNTFKMEMEVHENSKIYTHFF